MANSGTGAGPGAATGPPTFTGDTAVASGCWPAGAAPPGADTGPGPVRAAAPFSPPRSLLEPRRPRPPLTGPGSTGGEPSTGFGGMYPTASACSDCSFTPQPAQVVGCPTAPPPPVLPPLLVRLQACPTTAPWSPPPLGGSGGGAMAAALEAAPPQPPPVDRKRHAGKATGPCAPRAPGARNREDTTALWPLWTLRCSARSSPNRPLHPNARPYACIGERKVQPERA